MQPSYWIAFSVMLVTLLGLAYSKDSSALMRAGNDVIDEAQDGTDQTGNNNALDDLSSSMRWCLQCSWGTLEKNTDDSSVNSTTNSTSSLACWIGDLEDPHYRDKVRSEPITNPLCNRDISHSDPLLLSGVCYDYACHYRADSEVSACIKWTTLSEGSIVSITRACIKTVTGGSDGCYTQNFDNGTSREVCICTDQDFCNSGHQFSFSLFLCIALLFIAIFVR